MAVPFRQFPRKRGPVVIVPASPSATISGQIRISSNPSVSPTTWKQPVNQPLRNRVPRRQQPHYPVKILAGAVPAAPTNLIAIPDSEYRVRLQWSDTNSDWSSFSVERSPDGVTYAQIVVTSSLFYLDLTTSTHTTYYYRVKAQNFNGYSIPSNVAQTLTDFANAPYTSKVEGWMFPTNPYSPVTDYTDGRVLNTIKPEYFTVATGGVVTQLNAPADGTYAYSSSNLLSVKGNSLRQVITVSSAYTNFHALMGSPTNQAAAITTLVNFCVTNGVDGIELDWEGYGSWTAGDYSTFKTFLSSLATSLHANNKVLMVDVPPISDGSVYSYLVQTLYQLKYEEIAPLVDYICVLAYDFEFDFGAGFPVQPTDWLQSIIKWAIAKVGWSSLGQIVIGMPAYGYHGTTGGFAITIDAYNDSAGLTGFATATRDSTSQEMTWTNAGSSFFFSDQTTLNFKRKTIEDMGILNVAVWYLGGNKWFTGRTEPVQSMAWIPPVKEPLKYRVPKRQQPRYPAFRFLVPTTGSSTITGQLRISSLPSVEVTDYIHGVNQPLRSRIPKRQQPFYPAKRFLVTTTASATLTGQLRISSAPSLELAGFIHDVNQPLKSRVPKRQQPSYLARRLLVTSVGSATLTGQLRISAAPSLEPTWFRPANQPLRSRIPKRQQIERQFVFLVASSTVNSTLTGQLRISAAPSLEHWTHPVNEPLRSRVPRRQQPRYPFYPGVGFRPYATNFGFENHPTYVADTEVSGSWIDGTLLGNSGTPYGWSATVGGIGSGAAFDTSVSHSGASSMRLSQASSNCAVLVSTYRISPPTIGSLPTEAFVLLPNTEYIITGYIRTNNVATNGVFLDFVQFSAAAVLLATTSSAKLSGTNSNWTQVQFIVTTSASAAYGGIILHHEVRGNISDVWFDDIAVEARPVVFQQPVNQPLRSRTPRRQQPQSAHLRPLFPTTASGTITGQLRISASPASEPTWIHPIQQPLRSRVSKRQQPVYPVKRFLTTTGTVAIISGQIRVSSAPNLNPSWIHAVNQFLRRRFPKRQQPVYPVRGYLATIPRASSATIGGQISIGGARAPKPPETDTTGIKPPEIDTSLVKPAEIDTASAKPPEVDL